MRESPATKAIAASDVRFTGSIPEVYDRYLGPVFFEPYAVDLAARVARLRPRNLLEIAAGTGIVTRRLLEVLPPGGRLTATDLNEPMLDIARRKIGSDPRVRWRQADALELPFGDGEFDAVVCQFGLMFFPDKPKGLSEFHRVLVPGGKLLFNVWDSLDANAHGSIAHSVIGEAFEVDAPAFYEVPFVLSDVAEVRSLVTGAGFAGVEIETIARTGESPSAADAAIGLVRGNPCINVIMERGPEKLEDIERTTTRKLAERYGDTPLRIPTRAHVASAVRPLPP